MGAGPKAGEIKSILIKRDNASTKHLNKDFILYFRSVNMDRPQLLA